MTITDTTLPLRTYLVWHKTIKMSEITNQEMWKGAFAKVFAYAEKHHATVTGPGSALYLTWDMAKGETEFGIGVPVEGIRGTTDSDLALVTVAECAAYTTTVMGDYAQLKGAHSEMMAHAKSLGKEVTLVIEEYAVTGMQNPDPASWTTNLYYLHR